MSPPDVGSPLKKNPERRGLGLNRCHATHEFQKVDF